MRERKRVIVWRCELETRGVNRVLGSLVREIEKAEYLLESLTETITSFKEAKAAERAKKEAAEKEVAEKLAIESEESED